MTITFGTGDKAKEYKEVAERLDIFFGSDEYAGYRIVTEVVAQNDTRIIMRASIFDGDGVLSSTGTASQERFANSFTPKDTECCETHAVGRALAFLSKELMGSSVASADEIMASINEKETTEAIEKLQREKEWLILHNDAWKRHEPSVHSIKEHLANNRLSAAWEEFNEIPQDDQTKLKVAATKGGCFTVEEGKLMAEAKKQDFDVEAGVFRSIAARNE